MAESFSPFYCGTQYADWMTSNCMNCKKFDVNGENTNCELDDAIAVAFWGDGNVPEPIAERMSAIKYKGLHNWPCGEIDTDDKELLEAIESFDKND